MLKFNLARANKGLLFLIALSIGIVLGIAVAAKFDWLSKAQAEIKPQEDLNSLFENAVTDVASKVGPAVVSISTLHIPKDQPRTRGYDYRQPYGGSPYSEEELFRRFFEDFFGEMPGPGMSPDRDQRQMGLGSGVIIDEDGYILTNEHVVEFDDKTADKITVTLADGREFSAELKGVDARSDLAVIKINAKNLPVAALGDSDNSKIGQWVVAIGNPFGYLLNSPEPTVTSGVISALHRTLPRISMRDRDYGDLIQTDAAINPGNSGGPLCNLKGEVIGISVAIFSSSGGYQGIGFAIPSNTAKRILDNLIAGKEIEYGWLGVTVQGLTPDLKEYFSCPDNSGVLVTEVFTGSPAEEAGIRKGDIIISFDNQKVKNLQDLLSRVGRAQVAEKVKFEVWREKKKVALEVKMGKRTTDIALVQKGVVKPEANSWRGLTVTDINERIAQAYQLSSTEGVIVIEVEAKSPAEEAGLVEGLIITEVNHEKITDVSGFSKVVSKISKSRDVLAETNRGYVVIKSEE